MCVCVCVCLWVAGGGQEGLVPEPEDESEGQLSPQVRRYHPNHRSLSHDAAHVPLVRCIDHQLMSPHIMRYGQGGARVAEGIPPERPSGGPGTAASASAGPSVTERLLQVSHPLRCISALAPCFPHGVVAVVPVAGYLSLRVYSDIAGVLCACSGLRRRSSCSTRT